MYALNVFHITVSQDTHLSFPSWAEYSTLKRLGTRSFCISDALGFCSDCICIMNILKMEPEDTHKIHFHIIHTLYAYTQTDFFMQFYESCARNKVWVSQFKGIAESYPEERCSSCVLFAKLYVWTNIKLSICDHMSALRKFKILEPD